MQMTDATTIARAHADAVRVCLGCHPGAPASHVLAGMRLYRCQACGELGACVVVDEGTLREACERRVGEVVR